VVEEVFSAPSRLRYALDFESALARALLAAGIAPAGAARSIEEACDSTRFDLAEIAREGADAGNEVIPIVERLRAIVAERDASAASYVHWGATSQDVIDTVLVLQLKEVREQFDSHTFALSRMLANLATEHASTPIIGRTWLQHASPTTFGLKAAGWLDAVVRHRERFAALWPRVLVVQFGGSVGTLAALGTRGPTVAAVLASELSLARPAMPWHSARDRFAEVATCMGLLVGTLGKIAHDIVLLSQSEVGEAQENHADGRGRSSTMPHKRNPVSSARVLAAAMRMPGLVATSLAAVVQEHERGLGGWQAEWTVIPEICVLAFAALRDVVEMLDGLVIDRDRMSFNIEATRGLVFGEALAFTLAEKVGRMEAAALTKTVISNARRTGEHLRDVVMRDSAIASHLTGAEIERVFDARNYLGAAESMAREVAERARGDGA
jgi:3-carboxy-cis,cis-muconate cycloisomerase